MIIDSLCKSAKRPEDSAFKCFADSNGMFLDVTKSGGKYWQLKYHKHPSMYVTVALGNRRLL